MLNRHLNRHLRRLAVLAGLVLSLQAGARAAFPDHPLHFVVPFTAGGNTDIVARIVGKGLSAQLGQPVVVENRPGANAMIGAGYVAHSRPDGYTMLLATAETLAINPHLYKKIAYDALKDFSAAGVIDRFPFALVVSPKLPVKTLADFVEYARHHQGKMSFSSWGVGSTSQIAFEQFLQTTHLSMLHIPYQGAAPAITAVAAGEVDAFMVPLAVAVPQAKAGHVKLLAVTSPAREDSAPQVPTMKELGYPVVIGGWHILSVPEGTPAAAIERLNKALNAAVAMPEIRDVLLKQGVTPAPTTPQQADQMAHEEWRHWGDIIKAAGISAK